MTMIERAAGAIHACHCQPGISTPVALTSEEMTFCLNAVRAVLAAIREPDDAMFSAIQECAYYGGGGTESWKAVIDAILQEKPE